MWETLLDFLFPPHCPRCRAYVAQRGAWCPGCLRQTALWLRLALPTGAPLAAAWAAGHYRGGLRDLIRGLKYQGRRENLPYIRTILETMPAGLRSSLAGTASLASVDSETARTGQRAAAYCGQCTVLTAPVAVPVPLFPAKERQRGFNQTELIFRDWLAALGIPLVHLLVRTRPTRPQYGLTRTARLANVCGAFALAPDVAAQLKGRDVLLLDDIFTTGTTATVCAQCLRRGGASRVVLLALASDHAAF